VELPKVSNWEETPGPTDPEPAGGIIYPIRPGNASGSPRRNWRVLLKKDVWRALLSLLPP